MTPLNPALFYFYGHDIHRVNTYGESTEEDNRQELDTPTFHQLVEQVDHVFLEQVVSTEEDRTSVDLDEYHLNNFIRGGPLSSKLQQFYDHEPTASLFLILNCLRGSSKSLSLERTYMPKELLSLHEVSDTPLLIFNSGNLNHALRMQEDILAQLDPFQQAREVDVADQINRLPGTVLVIFGSQHRDLEHYVARSRQTTVHFPYADFPLSYRCQMWQEYRRDKRLDLDLFLRTYAEGRILAAMVNSEQAQSFREADLASHFYASHLTPQQIVGLRDYTNFCRGIARMEIGESFASFLRKEDLPSLDEVINRFRTSEQQPIERTAAVA